VAPSGTSTLRPFRGAAPVRPAGSSATSTVAGPPTALSITVASKSGSNPVTAVRVGITGAGPNHAKSSPGSMALAVSALVRAASASLRSASPLAFSSAVSAASTSAARRARMDSSTAVVAPTPATNLTSPLIRSAAGRPSSSLVRSKTVRFPAVRATGSPASSGSGPFSVRAVILTLPLPSLASRCSSRPPAPPGIPARIWVRCGGPASVRMSLPMGVRPFIRSSLIDAATSPTRVRTRTATASVSGTRASRRTGTVSPAGTVTPSSPVASRRPPLPNAATSTRESLSVGLASSSTERCPADPPPPSSQDSAPAARHGADHSPLPSPRSSVVTMAVTRPGARPPSALTRRSLPTERCCDTTVAPGCVIDPCGLPSTVAVASPGTSCPGVPGIEAAATTIASSGDTTPGQTSFADLRNSRTEASACPVCAVCASGCPCCHTVPAASAPPHSPTTTAADVRLRHVMRSPPSARADHCAWPRPRARATRVQEPRG